jgi:hypothetical protein
METSAIEKVINYYSSIVTALPIGGYGVKVLHDALVELAALKTVEHQPTAPNTSSPKLPTWESIEKEYYKWVGSHMLGESPGPSSSAWWAYDFICRQLQAGA